MISDTQLTSLRQRLRPLYIAAFFQGFVLWYAIEKLFMKDIGITSAGIAAIVVTFTLVMMIANLPLGILADRWSRKGVLALATIFLVTSTIVDGVSTNFWCYLVGSCLWGLYYAGLTGTYESVVYDTLLEETGSGHRFEYYYGKLQLCDGIALVASSLLAGLATHFFHLREVYFITVPFAAAGFIAILQFKEPLLHKRETKSLLAVHIRETLRAVLRRREVLWLTLSLIAVTVASRIILEFDQLWLIALALPVVLYGPVNALLLTGYGVSGMIANRLKERRTQVIGLAGVMVVTSSFLLFHVLSLTVVAAFTIILGAASLEVLINRWLHDALPSNIRTGAASTATTIGYGVFLPLGLLFGVISRRADVFHASWILIAVAVLITVSVTAASRRMARPSLNSAS